MKNFMSTILSAFKDWTKKEIKDSTADWNQNDSSANNYVKNRTHWTDDNGVIHTLDEKYISDSIARVEDIPEINYPVTSVNGMTGEVSLTATDVKARPDTWMPSASDVGALPSSTVIPTVPTNVSAFDNDAGYLTEHQSLDGLATEEYVNSAITNINTYYTKAEIDNMEFITVDDIDTICAQTIQVVSPTSVTF